MTNTLEPGQVRVGYLIDGADGTPYQAATLTLEPDRGPLLTVPYIQGAPQFVHTEGWFRDSLNCPPSLLFWDNEGVVALTDLQWGGRSLNTSAVGRLAPKTVIFGRPARLRPAYRFERIRSRFDGLNEFTGFAPVRLSRSGTGQPTTATVDPGESSTWRHGGYTFTIKAIAPWSASDGRSFTTTADSILETRRHNRSSLEDHVRAQWPVRSLMILNFGAPLAWREHWAMDRQFPIWFLDGHSSTGNAVRVLTRRTVADSQNEPVDPAALVGPLFGLQQLGTRGLKLWCSLYDDEQFRRAIEPVTEVVNGATAFYEPQLMMTAMSLDAMGYYRDPLRTPKTSARLQVRRCVDATNYDWSAIGSNEGISRAITNAYNDLKHPDRYNRPDGFKLSLITPLAILIMRMQLLDLLRISGKDQKAFHNSAAIYRVVDRFARNGTKIDDKGRLVPAT